MRRQRDEMRALADTDGLTGLPNRRAGLKRLEQHMRDARIGDGTLAVGFLDIDLFKRINDVHGHEAGDRVLVAVAATLTSAGAGFPSAEKSRSTWRKVLDAAPGGPRGRASRDYE